MLPREGGGLTDDIDLSDPLLSRQFSLEALMLDSGAAAYRSRLVQSREKGRGANDGGPRKLLAMALAPLADAIRSLIAHAASGAPGKRHIAVKKLEGLDPEIAAFLTLAETVNAALRRGTGAAPPGVQVVAMKIGTRIEDEARLAAFAKGNAGLLRHVMQKLNAETSNEEHKRTVLYHLMNKKGDGWQAWTPTERLHLGTRLVDLLIEATGLVEKVHGAVRPRGKNKSDLIRLELTDEAAQLVADFDAHTEKLLPANTPMVVPPMPWTGPRTGGYRVVKMPLVKGRGHKGRLKLTPEEAPEVYESINLVQATPWRINRRLFEALTYAWDHNLTLGLPDPRSVKLKVPPKPHDIATNEEARRAWRTEARQAYLKHAKERSTRAAVARTLKLAETYTDDAAIYFPHQLDFRGRQYAAGDFLSPQGADYSRALLEFAEAKAVGEETGAGWLAIHGANTFGYDKVSLEERIAWVEERNDLIARTAEEPFADLWWADADKPWCFLAWCFEWAGYLKDGTAHASRIPIALDGSCNGLQHYSAMLRDPVGGAAVNLIPSETPADIYARVAGVVDKRLYEAATEQANAWGSFGIDRKITKRPVMVLPYGGTQNSCHHYVEEAYLKKLSEGAADPFTKDERKAAVQYLAGLVWSSIGEVVVAAREAMAWLRAVARVATAAGIDIRWTAPSGFRVVQDYRSLARRRVKTRLSGAITYLMLTEETDKLDGRQQANGLPPNFVHSNDASALSRTVVLARANGITNFAMVHDSFGTHAADTQMLSACIREAFVEMYEEHDPLAELEEALRERLPPEFHDKIPQRPARGTLDLKGVLQSDFFFA